MLLYFSDGYPFNGVGLEHAVYKVLDVGGYVVRHVELAVLDLVEELTH